MAKYSKGAQKSVEMAMKRMEKGTLRSGKSGEKVTNPKQAIAIGLSEAKKNGARVPSKKTAAKKTVAKKKVVPQKAAAKKVGIKKKSAAGIRKPVEPVIKKATPGKTIPKKSAIGAKREEKSETAEANLPPVEEKSPEVNSVTNGSVPGMDTKSIQRVAISQYDNHHIRLSNRKGGIKPSGKKPLW